MPKYVGRVGLTLVCIYGISQLWSHYVTDNNNNEFMLNPSNPKHRDIQTHIEPNGNDVPQQNHDYNPTSSKPITTNDKIENESSQVNHSEKEFNEPNTTKHTEHKMIKNENVNEEPENESQSTNNQFDHLNYNYGARLRQALYQIYRDHRRGSEF
eukprot:gb/GECH01000605.1/.p1 GENE.gb/GECH01000605.1/~~gb/GECH01000605.1/.p1  ORF type:complete len:155 (+),score=36.39 gb/GECH01000605.1/:1-465(+)